jgi:hypothetical protein
VHYKEAWRIWQEIIVKVFYPNRTVDISPPLKFSVTVLDSSQVT